MAEYLNNLGVKTRNGSDFQCNTVNRILKNRLYCGYYVAGDTSSPKLENLVIIDENVFDEVQKILRQRSKKNDEKQHIARTTKGKTLLSGNLYCAHCGGKLVASAGKDSYRLKDGTVKYSDHIRYVCYHRTRKLSDCDGQSVYQAERIDEFVLSQVKHFFNKLSEGASDKILEARYKDEINMYKKDTRELYAEKEKYEKCLKNLSVEIGQILIGESILSREQVLDAIYETKKKILHIEERINENSKILENRNKLLNTLAYKYNECIKWEKEFDNSNLAEKKMIICKLIKEIKVGKGYKIEIKFDESYKQFIIN